MWEKMQDWPQNYASYFDNIPYFTADITLSGKKSLVTSDKIINLHPERPAFKR